MSLVVRPFLALLLLMTSGVMSLRSLMDIKKVEDGSSVDMDEGTNHGSIDAYDLRPLPTSVHFHLLPSTLFVKIENQPAEAIAALRDFVDQ